MFFFCYIPWFEKIIGTTRVPFEYWLLPISFGMGLLVLEELVLLSKDIANYGRESLFAESFRIQLWQRWRGRSESCDTDSEK